MKLTLNLNTPDTALAIDGKTMRGAVDDDGRRTHVLGIVGHESAAAFGQKKPF